MRLLHQRTSYSGHGREADEWVYIVRIGSPKERTVAKKGMPDIIEPVVLLAWAVTGSELEIYKTNGQLDFDIELIISTGATVAIKAAAPSTETRVSR